MLKVQLSWADDFTWMEYLLMPKAVFLKEIQEGKRDRGAPRKRYEDQLKRQLAQEVLIHQFTRGNQPSVMAADGLRQIQLALIREKKIVVS